MDDSRRVVLGVGPVKQRLRHGRLAQIIFHVSLGYSCMDGLVQPAADEMHVLADIDKYDRQSRVLADRHIFITGDIRILQQLSQDFLATGGRFTDSGFLKRFINILGQVTVRLFGQLGNRLRNLRHLKFSHILPFFPDDLN